MHDPLNRYAAAGRADQPRFRPALLSVALLALATIPAAAQQAPAPVAPAAEVQARVATALPALEQAVTRGMEMFKVPGAVVGVVVGDELVFAKGFGAATVGGAPVGASTVFQIGSTTKAFLATTLAMMVDEKKLSWDTRVAGLAPEFVLHDPWVTREFRVYDLLAQRSGLRPYTNDGLAMLGYDADAMIRSLRFVPAVTSFRSTFAYVNIPHMVAGQIVAHAAGAESWNAVVADRIFGPLGMTSTSTTAEAIEASPDHAVGHAWKADGPPEALPFDPSFPYKLGPAGDINSSVEDMSKWVRMLLAGGTVGDKRLVSQQNLAYTQIPKVAINEQQSYAMGWVIQESPNGRVIWHNGGTSGFGTHVGLVPHLGVGIIVLSNLENRGFPDAAAAAFYQALLGNPPFDAMTAVLDHAKAQAAETKAKFTPPATPRPPRDLAAYAAAYDTEGFGPATVRVDGGALVMRLDETGAELALEPFDGDVFTVRMLPVAGYEKVVAAWGAEPFGFAQFQVDNDGRLDHLAWTIGDDRYLFDRVVDAK